MSKLNWWKTACAVSLLCETTAIGLRAQTLTTLHSFDGTDGTNPYSPLVQATNGDLYGTTYTGKANGYAGTVFKITPTGALTKLYGFCSQSDCADGDNPFSSGLVQTLDGSFYGTTRAGGAGNDSLCFGLGCGTIFKIAPNGALTTIHSFCSESNCTDGALPTGTLIQATDGNFYGATTSGGAGNCAPIDNGVCGTLFRITPEGTFTTIYSFCSEGNCMDGSGPSGLIQATDGNFYGATAVGGTIGACGGGGCGTVFSITPGGTLTTLHSFDSTDGSFPEGVIQATDGNFYGVALAGGTNGGGGTVFKITPSGTLTTLHNFDSADGLEPYPPLVQATDGNFYGTTFSGGSSQSGTIFRITASRQFTRLYSFCDQGDCMDGANPSFGLIQDTNGSLYGTTVLGGTGSDCISGRRQIGCGTVFSLSVGLGPFVETLPTSGKVGAAVKILGTDLTGATSVTFNGTPATFAVEASSVIKATVPLGATTGIVQVVTPSGTLSSNVPFRVAP